ncbi:MAG TPA: portal protein, partial [Candidatus Paceibacterota bacterium]
MAKKKLPAPEASNDEDERYEDSESRSIPALDFGQKEVEAAPADYVPEGFESKEDFLKDMRETYALDLQFDEDNRTAALEDRKFVAGDQWDPTVLQQRSGLPCLVINTIPQFTAQLVGDWRENKNAIKVLPSVNGTKATADVIADLVRAIETDSRADRAYNNAFESLVQCGDGAFRVGVEYAREDVFDQNIVIKPIDDALAVVWDRMSIDPTGKDAKHCFVDDFIPNKEFKEEWPDSDPSHLNDTEAKRMFSSGWLDTGLVKVTEYWRMVERDVYLVMFEDGTIYKFDQDTKPEDFHAYIQKHGNPTKSRISPCRYAQMHLVTGFDILAGPYEWKLTRLPIIRMAGRTVTVGDKRVRYGLVRFMKDNVRLKNFWRSIAAEQLGYAPKAQWLATESAVEGKEEAFRKAHLTRDPLLTVNDEAIIGQNIQRIEPPPM